MSIFNNNHFVYLKKSYEAVGSKTWIGRDFIQSNLNSSINLFTDESLAMRKPIPKNLEVYALLSGLSFSKVFCNKLIRIQQDISKIINNKLHYWVLPENFGVEYCVFKWPDEKWDKSWSDDIKNELSLLKIPSFKFIIQGIQINQDGCIIAKGYDEEGTIFKIREYFKNKFTFLPKKQSGWAHVPIGRILEPIGAKKFSELRGVAKKLSNKIIATEEINTLKFVHETRWYMEKKSIIFESFLINKILK
jgi:hypothetical protein